MAGISNIIGAYNTSPKRVSSKLSFEIGQVFAAKIVAANELKSELILKLLDGWQFPAKLENPLDFIPEGLIRFEVEGFKDGKLQLKIVKDKKDQEEVKKSSIEDLIQKSGLDIDKEDYETLKNMIKHNMPLTKENIASVKTILDFKAKITEAPEEEEKFTAKYLNNKGVDVSSSKGQEAYKALKEFFSALKNISPDEILTMLQNDIELTAENIKSFKKLSSEEGVIYKELKQLGEAVADGAGEEGEQRLAQFNAIKNSSNVINEEKEDSSKFFISKIIERDLQSAEGLTEKDIEQLQSLKNLMDGSEAEFEQPVTKSENLNETKLIAAKEKENSKAIEKTFKDIIKFDRKALENTVKEQLASRAEEMKNIIKNLIEDSSKPEEFAKVLQNIKEYVNDFKVFNSLSNQYYYMDVPINLNRDEYQCRLLIKDDRKLKKKIDSRNVSLVVSVKTTALGMVDAYIKVKEQNMSVDIKCEEDFMKLLSLGKDSLIKELSDSGYNVFVNVSKREKEISLSNYSDFFDDTNLSSINVRA